MRFNYNQLVQKVDIYLRTKRESSRLWACCLPEKLFTPSLWLWEPRSVATGAAWGVAWALAPVPMQTIFALLCSVASRGNVPMSVLSCWISFPGYQVILWPLQWYLGAALLGIFGLGSGVDMELIRQAAAAAPDGLQAALHTLGSINLLILCAELLLGCLISCVFLGLAVYAGILLCWRKSN